MFGQVVFHWIIPVANYRLPAHFLHPQPPTVQNHRKLEPVFMTFIPSQRTETFQRFFLDRTTTI